MVKVSSGQSSKKIMGFGRGDAAPPQKFGTSPFSCLGERSAFVKMRGVLSFGAGCVNAARGGHLKVSSFLLEPLCRRCPDIIRDFCRLPRLEVQENAFEHRLESDGVAIGTN